MAIPTSNKLFLALYAPIIEKANTAGIICFTLIVNTFENNFTPQIPINPIINTVNSMPNIKVYVIAACSTKSFGPGISPWMVSAPKIMAEVAEPGIPNASNGTNEPPTAALLALSGAIIPSSWPLPNKSFCFEDLLASPYPIKDAMAPPVPGRMPIMVPIIEDLTKSQPLATT